MSQRMASSSVTVNLPKDFSDIVLSGSGTEFIGKVPVNAGACNRINVYYRANSKV